ncbi:hypothetical protein FGO68_gene10235 [Halteria grandinella]|uniref:Uncharacterized protein n=1 Tax=Halteria grandinella TaxID=5974 RepID=A0A8J8NLX5_HALGN|nr:hypothetical protein FGO68_gene10235 [Halteria grandinella]
MGNSASIGEDDRHICAIKELEDYQRGRQSRSLASDYNFIAALGKDFNIPSRGTSPESAQKKWQDTNLNQWTKDIPPAPTLTNTQQHLTTAVASTTFLTILSKCDKRRIKKWKQKEGIQESQHQVRNGWATIILNPQQRFVVEFMIKQMNAGLKKAGICDKAFKQSLFKNFKDYITLEETQEQYENHREIEKVRSEIRSTISRNLYNDLKDVLSKQKSLYQKDGSIRFAKFENESYFQKLLFSFKKAAFINLVEDYPNLKAFSLTLPYIQKHLSYPGVTNATFRLQVQVMIDIVDFCLSEFYQPEPIMFDDASTERGVLSQVAQPNM